MCASDTERYQKEMSEWTPPEGSSPLSHVKVVSSSEEFYAADLDLVVITTENKVRHLFMYNSVQSLKILK